MSYDGDDRLRLPVPPPAAESAVPPAKSGKFCRAERLIEKGRLRPITKTTSDGRTVIVGFERSSRSRKAGRRVWLTKAMEVKP